VNFSLNLKILEVKKARLAGLGLVLFFIEFAAAQNPIEGKSTIVPDSIYYQANDTLPGDTTKLADQDTTAADSAMVRPESQFETTVYYKSQDSARFDNKHQVMYLYGQAEVEYGDIKLEAAEISINYRTQIIRAKSYTDTAGVVIGKPVFTDQGQAYETDSMKYNFKSRKAYIYGVVTEQEGGYVTGDHVKKNKDNDLFIDQARYTTCNLAHPHFYINSKRLKIIPGKEVVTGPFNMYIADIPTPLGFAFGMFPNKKTKTSGILFPSFGEERNRGFYLRDAGYFFAINDYVNLAVTGEIYSKGSFGLNLASQYRNRYRYNGLARFNFSRLVTGEERDSLVTNDFRFQWSHNPVSKGTSRFSASVNIATNTFNQNNVLDVQSNINTQLNSSLSYSKIFRGTPFNMSASFRHSQDVRTKALDLTLPDFALNMNRQTPFKRFAKRSNSWIAKTAFSYSMAATNQITNRFPPDTIVPFNGENIPLLLRNGKNGIRHTIPVSTSITLLKYFTLSPNFNYTERWYFKELNYSDYDPELGEIPVDTITKFARVYDFNFGVGMNTRMYGTLPFKSEAIQAIRHVLIPTVSYSWRPDFSTDRYGYYQTVVRDANGNETSLSRYSGFAYGTPGAGRSSSISFGLNNNLELKVRSRKDSLQETKKIPIFENLSFNTAYNFAADSFKLGLISMATRTNILNQFNINVSATLDPYTYVLDSIIINEITGNSTVYQRRIDKYAWNSGNGIGQIQSLNVAINTNLSPKGRKRDNETQDDLNNAIYGEDPLKGGGINQFSEDELAELEYMAQNPSLYVDFDIPWNLRVNYNFRYTKTGFEEARIIQSMTFSGDLSMTPKWKVGFNSGYDFNANEFTTTSINMSRDLHCWQMTFSWIPFGRFQSFNFTIRAKSSLLQDLKLNRTRSWFDR